MRPAPYLDILLKSGSLFNGHHVPELLILAEQGLGDEITFASMFNDILKYTDRLTVTCDPRLIPLYERSFPSNCSFISRHSTLDSEIPYFLPLCSLGRYTRNSIQSFENSSSGYLICSPSQQELYRSHLKSKSSKPIIGISWKSSLDRHMNRMNTVPLSHIIASIPNYLDYHFVNLQYGEVDDEINQANQDLAYLSL